jgi:Uma2 family endonuclease
MPFPTDLDDDVELRAPEEEMVPEHDLHRVLVDLLAAGLVDSFADDGDVAVFSRLAWFPDRADTRIRLDPDVMVVRGRPPGPRKSYKAWQEEGVAPAVLVEVWSDDDTDADYRRRLARARTYGVEEVVIVDPFAVGGVRIEHLRADGDRFRSVASTATEDRLVIVESLGISMAGGDELAVIADGRRWPTTAEAFRLARTEADRADREAARADRLAALLRHAGIDAE